jgi:hypothetical protein
MKGIIFNILEEMVIAHKGIAAWNEILNQEMPEGGIYTVGESYPDEQLFTLIQAVSNSTNLSIEKIVGDFGEFMFDQLVTRYPVFIEQSSDLKSFLKSVESVIHVEVKKLYDNPHLPNFSYNEPADDILVMQYSSPRKLCILAEGLIRGAAAHYKTTIEVGHTVCMHKGARQCDLTIRFL